MTHLNKPLALRLALGLDHTDAGQLVLGIASKKDANNTWQKLERDNAQSESLSNSMRELINTLLLMHHWADMHTPGCDQALEQWLHVRRRTDETA